MQNFVKQLLKQYLNFEKRIVTIVWQKNIPLILNITWFRVSLVKETINMKKLSGALAILVAAVMAANAQPVYSEVVGYTKSTFPTGASAFGVGFVKPTTFQGVPTSLTSTTMTFSGSNFVNLGPTSDGLPKNYVEIIDGPLAGYNADIISHTATVLTISADFSALVLNPTIVIREHIRASDVFKGNTSLTDYADTFVLNNPDGSQSSLLRDSLSSTGWIDAVSFTSADLIIYPGQAFLLNTSSSGEFTFSGSVKKTPTAIPLYASSGNFVSYSNPSATPDLQAMNLGENFGASEDYTATMGTFSTSGDLVQDATYLWAGALGGGLIDSIAFAPPVGVSVPGLSAIIVGVANDSVWIVPSPLAATQ